MTDRFGYRNKLPHVNPTGRTTWVEEPGDAFFRRYAGWDAIVVHGAAETPVYLWINDGQALEIAEDANAVAAPAGSR
jgi:aldehyde:ferredoxin oxidoreductase